ncbi:hypothetical protein M5E88_05850 [Akkermansia muciniphila]|nr:hypothetical protein M5E88_05850 [Akkermansia muciniphila]
MKQQLIERVMVQMPAAQPTSSPNSIPDIQVDVSLSLSVKLSPELYKQLEAKASQQGISLGDMVARSISSLINEQPEFPIPRKRVKSFFLSSLEYFHQAVLDCGENN